MTKYHMIYNLLNITCFYHTLSKLIVVNHISIKNVHIIIEVIFKALTQDFIIYKQVSSIHKIHPVSSCF